jgi:hypothetical protein
MHERQCLHPPQQQQTLNPYPPPPSYTPSRNNASHLSHSRPAPHPVTTCVPAVFCVRSRPPCPAAPLPPAGPLTAHSGHAMPDQQGCLPAHHGWCTTSAQALCGRTALCISARLLRCCNRSGASASWRASAADNLGRYGACYLDSLDLSCMVSLDALIVGK